MSSRVKSHKQASPQPDLLQTEKQFKQFRSNLLDWYQKNKRELPFRQNQDPYRIWLSEIMAQQTTLAAVVPYFERFVQRFATLEDVATASEQELLTYWQGLGYYSRIRNFQKACQNITELHNGIVPKLCRDLLKLPGVGSYTAAAIASICHNEAVAVIDGNVKRVLSRLFWFDKDTQTKEAKLFFDTKANLLLDKHQAGEFNQAMMELGSLVCRPKSPNCKTCPVQSHCVGATQNAEILPLKKKMSFVDVTYSSLLWKNKNDEILLKKPAETNLIRNMWELPSVYDSQNPKKLWQKNLNIDLNEANLNLIGKVQHSITNKKITVQIFKSNATNHKIKNNDHAWVQIDSLKDLPVSTISRKILRQHLGI